MTQVEKKRRFVWSVVTILELGGLIVVFVCLLLACYTVLLHNGLSPVVVFENSQLWCHARLKVLQSAASRFVVGFLFLVLFSLSVSMLRLYSIV